MLHSTKSTNFRKYNIFLNHFNGFSRILTQSIKLLQHILQILSMHVWLANARTVVCLLLL